jgi:hypothetical protein
MISVAPEMEGAATIVLHNSKVVSRMAADRLVRPPPLRNATVIEGVARPIFDRSEFDPPGHSVSGTTMNGTDQRQDPIDRARRVMVMSAYNFLPDRCSRCACQRGRSVR